MRGSESGQALVEAAFILPAFVFLLLVALQLTQLQQARLMAEYAAFAAARTGIVHSADNGGSGGVDGPMHDAAVMAVLPSFGRTDSFAAIARTRARFAAQDLLLRPFGLAQMRVLVLGPTRADFRNFGHHLDGQEIDFDDVRPAAADATLLSLQVRYLYELRVPFADRLVQTIWLAAHGGLLQLWSGSDWTAPRLGSQRGRDAVSASRAASAAGTLADGTPEGIHLGALVAAGQAHHYFLPLQAFYTMRLQSNPYLRWAHP